MLSPLIVSLLLFAVGTVVLAVGIFTLQSNHRSPANRVFFALTVAITIWSAGMALSTVANDSEMCETFRRFSAIGWGTAYSILLHFVLIITGKSSSLKSRRLYLFLYLPALFSIIAFAVPNRMNPFPYDFQQTNFGWVNVAQNNIWDWLFYIYYIGFTLIGLFLLYQWGKKSSDNVVKKKSRIIFLSITATLVLGTITDVVLSSMFSGLPQMAPAIMLIPVLSIYHILQNYRFGITKGVYKKTGYIILFTSVLVYIILSALQMLFPVNSFAIGPVVFDKAAIRGVISQIQVLISIYLVLKENRPGYISAVIINLIGLLSSIAFLIKSASIASLPGIISYSSVLVVITLIKTYKEENNAKMAKEKYNNEHVRFTGLYNRSVLEKMLENDTTTPSLNKRALISLNLNLSAMYLLSLRYGYTYSRTMIKNIADSLKVFCDDNYLLFDTNEYRFVFYVKDYQDEKKLTAFCEKLSKTISSYIYTHGINVGIGVFQIDKATTNGTDDLLKKLVNTSEEAVKSNRSVTNILFHSKELDIQIAREYEIGKEIREIVEGIKTDRLYLQYQPIFDISSNKVCGFEALARLSNEKYGLIPPLEFIPIAEKTNMIIPLGELIILRAFHFLKKLKENGHETLSISINISAIQMLENGFADRLLDMLKDMRLNPETIGIELTESVFSAELMEINTVINTLKATGIKVLIDDFGTGYSSFARERELSIDCLKIDKIFIDKLLVLKPEEAITGDIISMAHKLGHCVVAEGIEHENQLHYLREHGCDKVQGYLISKPLDEEDAFEFLKNPGNILTDIQITGTT